MVEQDEGPEEHRRWRHAVKTIAEILVASASRQPAALMVLVLLLGAGLGGIVHILHKARLQREAVAAIERAGGDVMYDYQWKDGEFDYSECWWPQWLENRVGIDCLSDVVYVDFDDGLSDEKLEIVGRLLALERLNDPALLTREDSGSSVTDAGVAHLRGLARLETLDLWNAKVTDAGVVHLRGLTGLQGLDLSDTGITDAGLVHVGRLTGLRALHLSGTPITDAGLVHLRGLKNLRILGLAQTPITDAGLVHLDGLADLQDLALNDTEVTEAESRISENCPSSEDWSSAERTSTISQPRRFAARTRGRR